MSSHAQIPPQGAEKLLRKVNVVVCGVWVVGGFRGQILRLALALYCLRFARAELVNNYLALKVILP